MPNRSIRILNVNDREIPRYVTQRMLASGGYEPISVATGSEALDRVGHEDFDVVLLDVQLPDLDGFEVCRRIKGEPRTHNTIVLLTSATFVTPANKVLGLDAGADGYLVQPYEAQELYATLRSLLRARVAERRASALAEELRGAMAVRDEFLAMLGHELRNPLATITNALHVMEQKRDPETQGKYVSIVQRGARSLERIVGDLLDVARITRGKIQLERVVVDLRDVAQRCLQSLSDEIAATGHEASLAMSGSPVRVYGDVVRLEQIASNLVTNAIKYTPAGGHIKVRVTDGDGRAKLEVSDDGIGMSPEMVGRVFDVFVQGSTTIDRARGGLGLGLTVVRQLVELHDGTVSAHSDGEGKGSRFLVDLPIADVRDESKPVAAPPPEPAVRGLRIVVIEDNEDARETLKEALVHYHHHVDTAVDGLDGLELVLKTAPDVVLVDIGLPRLDGYEVARQIRARMDGTSPKLIAMTGYGQPEDRARAHSAGFDLHVVKPVSLKSLQQAMANLTTASAASH